MNEDLQKREQLSALADGELGGGELAQALQFADLDEGRSTWQVYHLVGDVLRSPELASQGDNGEFMARLQQRLALEPGPARPVPERLEQVALPAAHGAQAANAAVFRWKMVAGFASLAAVATMGWHAMTGLQSDAAGAQLAAAPTTLPVATAEGQGAQVMLRDPRLDELLAAHQQFGGASALQMPAGFLRNATFDAPAR